jgi:hypothetical protein
MGVVDIEGVHVALGPSHIAICHGLEDDGVARLLKPCLKGLVVGKKSDEIEGTSNTVMLRQVNAEAMPVDTPTKISDSKIEILPIDECEVGWTRARHA